MQAPTAPPIHLVESRVYVESCSRQQIGVVGPTSVIWHRKLLKMSVGAAKTPLFHRLDTVSPPCRPPWRHDWSRRVSGISTGSFKAIDFGGWAVPVSFGTEMSETWASARPNAPFDPLGAISPSFRHARIPCFRRIPSLVDQWCPPRVLHRRDGSASAGGRRTLARNGGFQAPVCVSIRTVSHSRLVSS